MPTILYLRCPHCGYENNPEYRFCGMCGTSLPRPPSIQREPPRRESVSEPRLPDGKGAGGDDDVRQQGGGRRSEPERKETARVAEASGSYPLASLGAPEDPSHATSPAERNEAMPRSRWAPEVRPSDPVSGPSFLGLADDPGQSVSYLLDDDAPPVGRRRTIAVLLIMLAVGSFLAWHWKHTGSVYPWVSSPSGTLSPEASGTKPASEAAPENAQSPPATPGTKSNPAADTQVMPPGPDAKAVTPPAAPASPDQSAPTPASTADSDSVQNDDSTNAQRRQSSNAAPAPLPAASSQPSSSSKGAAEETSPDRAAAAAKKSAADEDESLSKKASKPSQPDPEATAENQDKGEPLFIQGQRYLYGTGVRQNCDLAQKSLIMAAENSNIQAQSTLATMYATGHCVPRSLPLAYRWFAKASHLEPSNSRIEQDLEILWKQMTPEEKQIAIKSR